MNRKLLEILGLKTKKEIVAFAQQTGVSYEMLIYYDDENILPSTGELERIANASGIGQFEIMLGMGILDQTLIQHLSQASKQIGALLDRQSIPGTDPVENIQPVLQNSFGRLYQADCLQLMKSVEDNSVDLVFADPPFNLNKLYPSNIDDNLIQQEYLSWCEQWMQECIRILKPGGSFFLWNIPKWNTYFSNFLNQRLTFRHWIAADIKFSLPIQGKLYPSHYSLLYYIKGKKPNTFKADRMPMEICPKCKNDLKDYGGYKDKMNPLGVNLTDVWYDIPPVRHSKYKKRKGANELSIKLLDRIIEMASQPGDLVFDPFGGSGSTYVAAEIKGRKWLGVEIGPVEEIIDRLQNLEEEKAYLMAHRRKLNHLFSPEDTVERKKRGLWTTDSFIKSDQGDQKKPLPTVYDEMPLFNRI